MKKVNYKAVLELIKSLENRLSDLQEDKNYMLSNCRLDENEFLLEYSAIRDDIFETEQSLDELNGIIHSDDTIVVDDELYYIGDDDEITYDIFS